MILGKEGCEMAEYATTLDGDTMEAFEIAAREIAEEKGMDLENVEKSMKKLIYPFITRI